MRSFQNFNLSFFIITTHFCHSFRIRIISLEEFAYSHRASDHLFE